MPPKRVYPIILATSLAIVAPALLFAETKSNIMLESTSKPEAANKMKNADIEKPRGQLLYETHCHACHETSVHSRNPRKAKSMDDIKYWVTRWSKQLKLGWSASDIDAVAQHVNSKYYHFK